MAKLPDCFLRLLIAVGRTSKISKCCAAPILITFDSDQNLSLFYQFWFWSESWNFLSLLVLIGIFLLFYRPTMFLSKATFHSLSSSQRLNIHNCPISTSLYVGLFQITFTRLRLYFKVHFTASAFHILSCHRKIWIYLGVNISQSVSWKTDKC